MKISFFMNLSELAQHMGDATEDDARNMRRLLVARGFENTEDVPDNIWMQLLEMSVSEEN